MKKIGLIVGTRPEAIKVIPIYLELQKRAGITPVLISTGQHQELLEDVFSIFDCRPDISFNVMGYNQALATLTRNLFDALNPCFADGNYDAILVQGDTTTAMVAGLVAFYNRIPLGHIEAGLRTGDIASPFPEEMNRRIVSLATRWHFAPTAQAVENLLRESVLKHVYPVGNSVIDAALMIGEKENARTDDLQRAFPFLVDESIRHVLVTAHRRENFGAGLNEICSALRVLARRYPAIKFLFPVHPNPNIQGPIYEQLGDIDNIYLINPLSYDELFFVLKRAFLAVTDSGGIQEEAPAFDVPVIVMRESTERPEGVEAGCSILAGNSADNIISAFDALAEDEEHYAAMAAAPNPYGDGRTSQRIADILCEEL